MLQCSGILRLGLLGSYYMHTPYARYAVRCVEYRYRIATYIRKNRDDHHRENIEVKLTLPFYGRTTNNTELHCSLLLEMNAPSHYVSVPYCSSAL